LITGDGTVIDNSAFLVENGVFARVARKGQIEPPSGAARVDLTGKTVMPAIVDAHTHVGWAILRTNTTGADTYSRENLIDHLKRVAYYGVSTALSMGIDPGETAYQVRDQPVPGAARLLTAGRGIAMPNAGPGQAYWRPVVYGVSNETEARNAVRELAGKKVTWVKIWVDDRNGTVQKLTPDLYRVIIDEAHKNNLRVVAHIYYLEDAKDLVRAGIDGFAHGVRDRDTSDEFMALIKERPDVFVIPNLPDPGITEEDIAWAAESLPPSQVKRMRDALAATTPEAAQRAKEFFGIQARNLSRMAAGSVKIAFGTDSSTAVGWNAHQEMADMVTAGMTPAEVITAATKTSAEVLRLDKQGTVAEGKNADFVVLDANPLESIQNTRRINKVFLGGTEIDRAAMKAEWTKD
jgi:imidazolonepropionase-like amidohydrolase